jgi:hypothetical protein
MSWSLELRNGDLTVDQGRLGIATGGAKLAQDIRCHLLERMGTDPLHRGFGSVLDGGTREDGIEIPSIIGEVDNGLIHSFVSTEINRILREHQQKQLNRALEDRMRYNKTTMSDDEILETGDIKILRTGDVIMVHITLHSSTGASHQIGIPLI